MRAAAKQMPGGKGALSPTASRSELIAPPPTREAKRQNPAASRALRAILALTDFEEPARRYLPRPIFGYISGGAETDASLRGNRAAFAELSFVPRVLVNTAARTMKTTIFGHTYDAPFGFSPMGGISMAAYQGDLVFARAAAEANIPM